MVAGEGWDLDGSGVRQGTSRRAAWQSRTGRCEGRYAVGNGVCAIQVRVDKVIRVAAGEEAAGWRDALSAPGVLDGAKVLKEDGGSWVRRARVMGRDVVVKCRVLSTVERRVKHLVGMGHGAKHWRGAELLMQAGIATGKPLALVRAEIDGKGCEVLVLEWVEGTTLLEWMAASKERTLSALDEHLIAKAVGKQLSLFGQAVFNRDHKPSNLIVVAGKKEPEITIIDCVGVARPQRWREPVEVLAPLVFEPLGCGVLPRRTLIARALRAYAEGRGLQGDAVNPFVRKLWVDMTVVVIEHGDPRPRVDPLGKR